MRIGIPKEIKNHENRVAITPAGVIRLTKAGHEVSVEAGAGLGSGIADAQYLSAGAAIIEKAKDIYADNEMIIKVKEPLAQEYPLLRKDQILYTYLHLAAEPALCEALMKSGMTAIGYETVQRDNGSLPLLTPMSEVAGKMAVQIGAHFLETHLGGSGVLMGGVPGVEPGRVVIVGGGVVGVNAAKVAIGMGAQVTIFDVSLDRLRYLDDLFAGRAVVKISSNDNLSEAVAHADLLIGAVLIQGARAPRLVTEEMVMTMRKGSVIVDVAIDQGGSVETIDRVTTHADPVFVKHGVMHYAVPNIPGSVARTSTYALTNATLPYAEIIAANGIKKAALANPAIARGINVMSGRVTHAAVAEALGQTYVPVEALLK